MVVALLAGAWALSGRAAVSDEVDRASPDFIRASLLVCGPGGSLYGCVGHAAIRLRCPHYGLDNVFSCEGEPIANQVLRFFAGDLKMGMFAVPAETFLREYRDAGRSVVQYPLALSPAAKVRLWKLLDERVAEGALLPYDYVKRGCAHVALRSILQAVEPESAETDRPPRQAGRTRRDILVDALVGHPWSRLLVCLIAGPEADRINAPTDVVVMPADLVDYLRGLRVGGGPVLRDPCEEIHPQTAHDAGWGRILSPMSCSVLLLVLSVAGLFRGRKPIHGGLLALQAVLAVLETYVCAFSCLPASGWNVSLVLFNPLPFAFWMWRKAWGAPYAAVLVAWSVWMCASPHRLTDPALPVLALAYAVVYAVYAPSRAFRWLTTSRGRL